jgi:hypothetical protein
MAQVEVIETKLDNLIDSFREFKEGYERGRNANIDEHKEILKVLNGNGQPGLKQEVMLNSRFRRATQRIYWFIGFSFLSWTGGLIWLIVKSGLVK